MKGMIGTLCGYAIVENPALVEQHAKQFFVPRSKKRRIRRKCEKKYIRRWTTPDPHLYKTFRYIFCHPSIAAQLRSMIEAKQRNYEEANHGA